MPGLKSLVRHALRVAGLEIYGARGGVYLCRAPRAGAAASPRPMPAGGRLSLRRTDDAPGGLVEVRADGAPADSFASDLVRLPTIPDRSVEEIESVGAFECLFRQERRSAIREWFRLLRPGGSLVIRGLPDFEAIAERYVAGGFGDERTAFGLDEVFLRTHAGPEAIEDLGRTRKDVFTRASLTEELTAAGYEIVRIERVQRDGEPAALWLDVVARKPA